MLSRVEEELHVPTLPEFTPGFSEVRIAQYVVFCIEVSEHYLLFCIFHVGHCVASPHLQPMVNPLGGVFLQWKWQQFAGCKHRRC